MKSLIALLIAVTFAFPVVAQNKTDKEITYALVGPVRTVRTETANVLKKDGHYVEDLRVLSMTISFNEEGNRTELGLYDEKGSLSRRIVSRFGGSNLVEFFNYDGAGNMWLRGVEHNDAEGRSIEKATYNGDGSLRSKTTLTRNARGQLIEMAEYDANGTLLDKLSNTFNAAGELKTVDRSYLSADGSLRIREVHNLSEKRTETFTYYGDGSLAGKSIRVNQEITEYKADGSLKKSTFLSRCGKAGRTLDL